VNRLRSPGFCQRPAKPWEGTDYFAKGSEAHIDLMEAFGGWGKATPSLHEFATACGIPGKMLAEGRSVVDLWLAGNVRRIVQYNECDALSTYLLWLRAALLAGHLTVDEHAREEERLERLLGERGTHDEHAHLLDYLARWTDLRASGSAGRMPVAVGQSAV
jgi:predicted PolB exonuclease-like 3'-5' exonuclease